MLKQFDFISKENVLLLLNKAWEYNQFKFNTSEDAEYFTNTLMTCDYDVSKDHDKLLDLNKNVYCFKYKRDIKFVCKKCNRIVWFNYQYKTLNMITATGIDNNGTYLNCDELVIKNIIE